MTLPRLLLATGLLALALPSAAHADSIVYIDQGNVWSARPDGSAKVQLTTGGGWHSPTQADDGTLAAVQGTGPITVMARDGRPLRTITTPAARSGDGGTFAPRPVQLAFSPDGSKIAYAYVASSCPVASTCGSIQRSTFYTDAGVTDATPHSVYGNQFSVSDPSWVTNSRTLVSGGYGSQVSIDDLGPGDYSQQPWMTPDDDMGDPEVSRDGKRLAVTIGYGAGKRLAFYAVAGDVATEFPPAFPDLACATSEASADERFAGPSWSPDGSGIAYESSAGIVMSRFTAFAAGTCAAPVDVVISATGSEPDWGPAEPPAAAYAPPANGTAKPNPAPAPAAAAKPALTLSKVTAAALRKGLAVSVKVPGPGRATVTASVAGRKVASGSATAKRAGKLTIQLSKVRTSLRGKTLTLKLTFRNEVVTKKLKVR